MSMTLKETIREKALELEFEDVGFSGVQPLVQKCLHRRLPNRCPVRS